MSASKSALDVIIKALTSETPSRIAANIGTSTTCRRTADRATAASAGLDGGRGRALDQPAARQGYNLLLDQYPSPEDVAPRIATVQGGGGGRAPVRSDAGRPRARVFRRRRPNRGEAAMKRRLRNRMRQLELAPRPGRPRHGGRVRPIDDPRTLNAMSALYGNPDEVAKRLEALRDTGVGYVLINAGGSGGGSHAGEKACAVSRAK